MDTRNENPFPGLRPFQTDEAHLFFGRDGQAVELLRLLREHRFVAVVGPSGSGKSSLVRAGLLPGLHGGFMRSAGSSWRMAVLRPGGNPFGSLARVLSDPDVLGKAGMETQDRREFMEITLRRGSLGLAEAVREARLPAGENLLVVVDQFEEIFRLRQASAGIEGRDDAAAFVKLLLEAPRAEDLPVYVLLTMRSDYLGDCAQFRDLPEAINRGQYLIPRMTRDERRAAVTGPVAVGGGEIAPRLVSRILNDVGDEPDQLPILQHALMRAWDRWTGEHEPGEPLDLRHYEAVGGAQDALSCHAEEAFADLDAQGQVLAEKVFRRLTERGPDNRDIRRPTRFAELCAVVGAEPAAVAAIVEVFRRPGRSFLMPPSDVPLEDRTLVDISHESLIRGWGRLRDWVEAEADAAKRYRRLADMAELWKAGRADLLRDEIQLKDTLAWWQRDRPQPAWGHAYHPGFAAAAELLELSRRQHDHERERRRLVRALTVAALVVGLMVTSALALIARAQAKRAYTEETKARKAADLAGRMEQEVRDSAKAAARARRDADRQRAGAAVATDRARRAILEQSVTAALAQASAEVAQDQLDRATTADRRNLEEQIERLSQLRGVLSQAREDASLGNAPSLLSQEAWTLARLGLDSAAERSYTSALQFNSGVAGILVNRSDANLNLGRPEQARADAELALRSDAHNYLAHLNMAVADLMLHHYSDAARGFRNALDATGNDAGGGEQSMVSPEIKYATSQQTLRLAGYELPAALRYVLASMQAFDSVHAGSVFDEVRRVGREEDWSLNAVLNALNWLWLSRKAGMWQQVSDYGQFAAEGALWERAGWSPGTTGRGVFAEEAVRSYCRFRALHQRMRSPRYRDLARRVDERITAMRPVGCSGIQLDRRTPHENEENVEDLLTSATRFAARDSLRIVDSLYAVAEDRASPTQRPNLLLERAENLLALGTAQFDLALRAAEQGDSAEMVRHLAAWARHLGGAVYASDSVLAQRPRYGRAYLLRGEAKYYLAKDAGLLKRDDMVASIVADLDSALLYQPALSNALLYRAYALTDLRPRDAVASVRQFLKLDRSYAVAWAYLAFLELKSGDYAAASTAADTAILLDPDYPFSYGLAEAASLKLPPDQLESPQVSLRVAPKFVQLGNASQVLRQFLRAERFYLLALREYSKAVVGGNEGLNAQLLDAGKRYRCIFLRGARVDPRRLLLGRYEEQKPEWEVQWRVPAALERAQAVLREIDRNPDQRRLCEDIPPS